jgi:predicted DNA-binding transcriptional regulator AlpA
MQYRVIARNAKRGHIAACRANQIGERHMKAKAKRPDSPVPAALRDFDSLPDSAIVRVGVVARVRGCSITTVWRHASSGLLPKPEKVSKGITGWRVGDLRRCMAQVGQ